VAGPYREAPPAREDPYLVSWEDLRRRRRLGWITFFGWAPVAGLLCSALYLLVPNEADRAVFFFLVIVPLALTAFATNIWASTFDCPGCGQNFQRRKGISTFFNSRCPQCGLEEGTPKGRGVRLAAEEYARVGALEEPAEIEVGGEDKKKRVERK
jgi:hypothetical protein